MKSKALVLFLLAAAALLAAGKGLVVHVLRSSLMAKPDFLSSSLAGLQRGDKLELIEAQGGWLLVRGPGGAKGYVHQSAVAESKSGLSAIAPGTKGASPDELALAAKGFDEANEKKLRGGQGYNFADLAWVMEQDVAIKAVARFMGEGGLK